MEMQDYEFIDFYNHLMEENWELDHTILLVSLVVHQNCC